MYSHEIERLVKLRNYLLDSDEYARISDIKENPQITHIKYEPYDNTFQMDTKDNYHFKFKVYKKENKR